MCKLLRAWVANHAGMELVAPRQIGRSPAWLLALLVVVGSTISQGAESTLIPDGAAQGADARWRDVTLQLTDKHAVRGVLQPCPDTDVCQVQVSGFERPFQFETNHFQAVRFDLPRESLPIAGDMGCELHQGDLLYGTLLSLDATEISLRTPYGVVRVPRSSVRRLIPQHSATDLVYLGPNGLTGWIASDDAWREESGRPLSTRADAVLFANLKIPPQACLEMELSWTDKPDFAISLGVGAIAVYARKAFRIESWQNDSIVLMREVDDKADVLMIKKIPAGQSRLHLVVYLDQPQGRAVAMSETREVLGEIVLPGATGTGVRIEAHQPGFKLERLQVTQWNGVIPAPHEMDRTRIHRRQGSVTYCDVGQYDPAAKAIEIRVDGQSQQVPLSEIDNLAFAPPKPQGIDRPIVRALLRNGMRVGGQIVRTQGSGFELASSDFAPAVLVPFEDLIALNCEHPSTAAPDPSLQDVGTLELVGQIIPGKVAGVTAGEAGSQLLWQPVGSRTAAPLARGASGRVTYREHVPPPEPERNTVLGGLLRAMTRSRKPLSQAGHTLHLRTGDAIPCAIEAISEAGVHLHSELSAVKVVSHNDVQAIVLAQGKPQIVPPKAKRQRLLTLPRMQRDSPPTHLIQSRTGDFLRTRVVSMDATHITTEVHLESKQLPRDHVAFITWLHDAAEVVPTQSNQYVQALRGDGVRITFIPSAMHETTLVGTSPVLGEVTVDLQRVDQLLIGELIEREASRLSFHRWKLRPALEPRYLSQADGGAAGAGQESPLVGQPAPQIELATLEGTPFTLASRQGKIVVLDFWATWCGPCVQWMPILEDVCHEFADKQVELVTVNLEEDAATVRKLLDRLDRHPTVLLDRDGVAAHDYQARAIPQTVVIDQLGNVSRLYVGGGPPIAEQLRNTLQELTKEPRPAGN